MKNINLIIILLFYSLSNTFAQNFQWVGQIKGQQDLTETANFIEVDNNGNSYTLGKSYSPQYDIDPTKNGIQLINNQNSLVSSTEDIYLTKLNANGDFIWGKSLSILKDDESVLGLKLDSQGNIYVLAFITELYQNQTLIYGYGFINVIKIDPNGNELYRHKFQNLGNINAGKLTAISSFDIDSTDNIYVSGLFQNTVILDSNPQNNLVANGNSTYIFKLNQNGDILWSKNLNFSLSGKIILKIDSNDKINLLFNSFDNLNNGHLLNILKLNNINGNQIWIKSIGNAYLNNFSLDVSDNFVIIGNASNNNLVDLNPDPNQSNIIQNKSFVLFLDSNGNYFDSKLFDLNITFNTIEIDNLNNYHLGGYYTNNAGNYSTNNKIDFDPSVNEYLLLPTAFYFEGFYLKLDPNRLFSKVFTLGSSPSTNGICYYGRANSLKVVDENIYIAGDFGGNCDLDPTLINTYLLNSINSGIINLDGFIMKIGNCDTLPPVAPNTQTFCSAKNPKISDLTPNSTLIKWYLSDSDLNQLDSALTLVNGQTYYATKQVGSCPESQRQAVNVVINESPIPPISTNQTFCKNENATISNLIATGQNIKWYSSPTETNNLSTNTALQNNTNYYVTQTINGCESNRELVTVTINSVPQPSINSPQIFCIQQNATINSIVVSGQNIKWYDSLTGGNLLSNSTNLVNGQTYYASQTINNCESSRAAVLTNIQNTPAPTGLAFQTFCSVQNPSLNDIVVDGTNLNWYISNSTNNTIPNTTPLINNTTYYVSQMVNGCESINRLTVKVNIINSLNANDYSETICDNKNDGIETINLNNYNEKLISNVFNNNFEYYHTHSGASNKTNSDLIPSIPNYILTTGNNTIFTRITSTNGCSQIVKLNLTLVKEPVVAIPDIVPICENKNITIDAGAGFDNYIWSNGETSQNITISQIGNYSVTVTKNYGNTNCSNTKNFNVLLSNVATITNISTYDWTDTENIINISTIGSGNYEYSIDGINYQNNNVFSGLKSGEYTVYVRDKNGCGITKDNIYLLMYPKFFTPNNDGYNDSWAIKFSNSEPKLQVHIFDRYGKLLKTLNNDDSWDGKHNGYELPSTDYWFVVTRENGKIYRGHFTLKR